MCVGAVAVSVVLLLSLTAATGQGTGSGDAQWKKPGDSITFQCSSPSNQDHLLVRKCCNTDVLIYQWNLQTTNTTKEKWQSRLKAKKPVTNDHTAMSITISNLTAEDTGVYLCEYQAIAGISSVTTRGAGSVVLVVRDAADAEQCDQKFSKTLVALLSIVVVLLVISFGFIFFSRKMETHAVRRPCAAKPSEVYEDMRSARR